MIFTTFTFVVFFLSLLVLMAFVRSNSGRIWLLLIFSYIFYGWWDYRFLLLLFAVSYVAWWTGRKMLEKADLQSKRPFLLFGLISSLGVLAVFKYFNFFIESFCELFGVNNSLAINIILPVGISFYVFQAVSYTIDIYRGNITASPSLVKFLLYVSFFPQLVAGPIVRAIDFLPQLDLPVRFSYRNALVGTQLFIGGAIQKVIIADNLGIFVDGVFSNPEVYSGGTLWLAMFAFAGQIFGDFSGYSLMAIGIARFLGFSLPQNFAMPYQSFSITEFWRRWHISLSSWLRDYLYISLGGNRKGAVRTYINLGITMVLGGLWHGASWNFVVWGAAHGAALAIHKVWMGSSLGARLAKSGLWLVFAWALTFLFVCFCWVPFRADGFDTTAKIFSGMFLLQDGISWLHPMVIFVLAVLVVWHLLAFVQAKILTNFPVEGRFTFLQMFLLIFVTVMVFVFAPDVSSPFVYFQF